MIKKLKNYVDWMRKNKIIVFFKKIVKIIDVIIIVIGLGLLINGYFSVSILASVFGLMVILIIYKWVGHILGIYRGLYNNNLPSKFLERSKERQLLIESVIETVVNKVINSKLCKKYPVVLEIIFWMFRMVPWNWWNSLLLKIFEVWHDMVIIISSNKDIYYKKRGKNKTMEDWSLSGKKYSYVFNWVIKYPILRLLLIPDKIRTKIFWYKSEWDLLRVRFIIYFYSIIYVYEVYYEYINEVSWIYKGIIIYVLVGVIWPVWICIQDMFLQEREYTSLQEGKHKYYKPRINVFFFEESSITKRLLLIYVNRLMKENDGLYNVKYNYLYGKHMLIYAKIGKEPGVVYYSLHLNKWKYEKVYGVSFFVYESLVGQVWKIKINEYFLNIYILGEIELGRENMEKKYGSSIGKLKAYYRCYDYLLMDVRRLLGLKKEEWPLFLRDNVDLKGVAWIVNYEKRIKVLELNAYKMVPERYMFSWELYNKLLIYSCYIVDIFPLTLTEFTWRYVGLAKGENSMLVDIGSKRTGSNLPDKKWEELTDESLQLSEGWTKEFYGEYKEEYEKIGDKRGLVSEKYIMEYKKKYMLK